MEAIDYSLGIILPHKSGTTTTARMERATNWPEEGETQGKIKH